MGDVPMKVSHLTMRDKIAGVNPIDKKAISDTHCVSAQIDEL